MRPQAERRAQEMEDKDRLSFIGSIWRHFVNCICEYFNVLMKNIFLRNNCYTERRNSPKEVLQGNNSKYLVGIVLNL